MNVFVPDNYYLRTYARTDITNTLSVHNTLIHMVGIIACKCELTQLARYRKAMSVNNTYVSCIAAKETRR